MMNRNDRQIIINATNLGRFLDGIGVYTLNILRELPSLKTNLRFIIYVNRSCAEHLRDIPFPEHCTIRWVSDRMSPDHKFKGHFLRLLYSNWLSIKHHGSLIFVASQLEAVFFTSKQVIMIHDVIPALFKRCHQKQYYYYNYLLRFALKLARVIITPSFHTKGLLEQLYPIAPEKVRVIHNGVRHREINPPEPEASESEPFILYTGRIARMKNITGALKAFALIKDVVPHKLVITGHGRERLKKEFDRSRLAKYQIESERVEFRGHVSFEEMGRLLRKASLLVFPSFYEGFGLPPLEAMAYGCPTVVSHVASLPEVCGDAAYYVDPYDVQSIADGMYTVLSNVDLRKRLIERGLERVKLYDWQRSTAAHMEVFEQVLRPAHEGVRLASLREVRSRGTLQQHPVAVRTVSNIIL